MARITSVFAAVALLAAVGCDSKKPPAAPAKTEPAATEPAPPAEPAEDPCVEQCLEDNQARATGWDQIKAECEQQCKSDEP